MRKLIGKSVQGAAWVGSLILLILALLMTADVAMRYLLNSSLRGSLEIVQFMLVSLFALGLAFTQRNRGNIAVDLFVQHAPRRMRSFLHYFNTVAALATFLIMAFATVKIGTRPGKLREVSDFHQIPVTWFYLLLAGGILLLCVQLIVDLVDGPSAVDAAAPGKET